jgi:hypothetical protein
MIDTNEIRRRRWGRIFLLAGFPLAALLACLGLLLLALAPMGDSLAKQMRDSPQGPQIPVTGPGGVPGENDTTPFPASTPIPVTPEASPEDKSSGEPGTYLEEAKRQMLVCYSSFQLFFALEQMVVDEPGLFQNEQWRSRSMESADRFNSDCGALNDLPVAPKAYQELDHWLRLSAGEASAAQSSFLQVIDSSAAGLLSLRDMGDTTDHLKNFIEYTHNAENSLQGVKDLINL